MKLLVALALIGLVAGKALDSPVDSVVEMDYHGKIGIPTAARLKAAEEALDFDGSRITGGTPSFLGQFPYIGGLLISMTTGATSVCGSTLLSNTRSVTAAHCWQTLGFQATQFTVVLGSTLLFSGGTRVETSDVVMHPNYDLLIRNDIAVIRLPWVTFNNNIRPIALATGNDDYLGTWAWASGFGLTGDGHSITADQFLSHVNLQVISNAECEQTYGPAFVLESTLCTSTTGGHGICSSDSGGPLANPGNNVLIGVTSFGHIAGCEAGFPAGFARVTYYAAWLQAHM